MTKKDYLKLAEAFNKCKPGDEMPDALGMWGVLVRNMTTVLYADNQNFNEKKFLEACGWYE